MSHCRRRAAATSRPAGSHEHIYRHSFRGTCTYFVGGGAHHAEGCCFAPLPSRERACLLCLCAPGFCTTPCENLPLKDLALSLPSRSLQRLCTCPAFRHCRRRRHRDLRLATCPCRKSDSACPPHAAAPAANHLTSPQVCAPFEGPVLRAAEVAYHCHRPQHTAHHWQHDFNCWCRETCSAAPPRACGCRCAWSFLA
jgi:hypothetical protein